MFFNVCVSGLRTSFLLDFLYSQSCCILFGIDIDLTALIFAIITIIVIPNFYFYFFAAEDPVMALRTLLSQCTTLETENRSLKASLRHEQAACSALLEELSEARQSHEGTLTQLQARSQALSR